MNDVFMVENVNHRYRKHGMQMLQIHFNKWPGQVCCHVFAAVCVRSYSRGEALSIALVVEELNKTSVTFRKWAAAVIHH